MNINEYILNNLNKINVHEIIFHRDGPSVIIRADLAKMPDFVDETINDTYNKLQFEIQFLGIKNLNIINWNTENILNIKQEKLEGVIKVKIIGNKDSDTVASFECDHIMIVKTSYYLDKLELKDTI